MIMKLIRRKDLIGDFLSSIDNLSYCHTHGLNGEWLMRFAVEIYGFSPICAPIFTRRYRADGRYASEKVTLRPAHLIHEAGNFKGYFRYLRLRYRHCASASLT